LIAGELSAPDTWEVALSSGADKRAAWERLLREQKLGALALVRNLRNLREAGVEESLVVTALGAMSTARDHGFRWDRALDSYRCFAVSWQSCRSTERSVARF
jgi:60 kDa SS-A/Ro ribonucleoprotein